MVFLEQDKQRVAQKRAKITSHEVDEEVCIVVPSFLIKHKKKKLAIQNINSRNLSFVSKPFHPCTQQ